MNKQQSPARNKQKLNLQTGAAQYESSCHLCGLCGLTPGVPDAEIVLLAILG